MVWKVQRNYMDMDTVDRGPVQRTLEIGSFRFIRFKSRCVLQQSRDYDWTALYCKVQWNCMDMDDIAPRISVLDLSCIGFVGFKRSGSRYEQ